MKNIKSILVLTILSFLLVTLLSVPVFPEDPWDVDDVDVNANGNGTTGSDISGGSDGKTFYGLEDNKGFNIDYFSRWSFTISYEIAKFLFGVSKLESGSSLMTTGQTANVVRTGSVANSSK